MEKVFAKPYVTWSSQKFTLKEMGEKYRREMQSFPDNDYLIL